MYISLKYVAFYTCTGGVVGYLADGDKRVAAIGLVLAAMMGYSFGLDYAILSAAEFGGGFFVGSILKTKKSAE